MASSIGDLLIRRARPEEAELFLVLLEECEQWLHARGNRQWVPGAHRPYATDFAQVVAAGDVYFAEWDGVVVATALFRVRPTSFWKVLPSRPAGYLSKLTSKRTLAGRGIGATMLAWAERYAIERGQEAVRLDSWADNPPLCEFYRRAGYTEAGRAEGYGGYRLTLFEKVLSPRDKEE